MRKYKDIKIIDVGAGHNVYNGKYFDCGATCEPYVEADITKETVKELIPMLESQGYIVNDVTPYNEKFNHKKDHHIKRCNQVDKDSADLYLDIHINAGKGTGVEAWTYSDNSKATPYAKEICKNISDKVGIPNRGVQYKPTYWSVSLCKAPAMIIEGGFIDTKSDMDKLTPKKYAMAIAECFGEIKQEDEIDNNSDTNKTNDDTVYKIQVGAYKDKDNAENTLNKLKEAGFEGFINEIEAKQKEEKPIEKPIKKEVKILEYKGLVKKGSKGDNVKELQNALNELGYICGVTDGVAGSKTIMAIELFQGDYNLVSDGIAGQATYNKINELLSGKVVNKPSSNKPAQSTKKSKYYKKGNVHIIETTPDNIEVKILGNSLHNAGVYGMNGTFYNMKEYNQPRACWAIATNDGKPIGGNSMLNNYSKIARGTIIYYKDGTMEVKRIVGTNEIKKPHVWAMGGYSIYPYFNLKAEKCPGAINYKTAHSYIGYKIVNGKPIVYLFIKPNHMIRDILPFVKEMKFDGCIVLDGGGSSQLRHPDGIYKSSRKVNNIIKLKEE